MLRDHPWPRATFFALSIALCVCVDIFQHSVPLPFLPQALEAQGHSAMEIASVMGGYYWSGCAGGALITSVMVYRLLYGVRDVEPTWKNMRSHIWKLILGLTLGCFTLGFEAWNPPWISNLRLHLFCRLAQGFVGAFLFFYAYLLAVKMFEGQQQVFALTCCSIALNVAEVFGPALGAAIFTAYGPKAPYILLVVLSVINNCILWVTVRMLPEDEEENVAQPLVAARSPNLGDRSNRWKLLKQILREPALWRAVVVIVPAACVKSTFEAILPFFGGMHHYSEMRVGGLFMLVAVAYIIVSVILGYKWLHMSETYRSIMIAFSLCGLACVAGAALTSYRVDWHVDEYGLVDVTKHELFYFFLILYGVFLGLTHTPAAYLLGRAVDNYEDVACQDTVNGIFNTCWELGGSVGFLLAGQASAHSWRQEQVTLCVTGALVAAGMLVFILTSEPLLPNFASPSGPKRGPKLEP